MPLDGQILDGWTMPLDGQIPYSGQFTIYISPENIFRGYRNEHRPGQC